MTEEKGLKMIELIMRVKMYSATKNEQKVTMMVLKKSNIIKNVINNNMTIIEEMPVLIGRMVEETVENRKVSIERMSMNILLMPE